MKTYEIVKEIQLHTFLTSALGGGEGQLHAPPSFPREKPSVPIGYEAGWAPEPI